MTTELNLEQIYDDHASSLFAFLLNLTRNETDSRDLLQDIFRKLVADPDRLRNVHTPRAYLLRLAHNLAVDSMRRRTVREQATDRFRSDSPDCFASTDDPDIQAFRSELNRALAALPSEQRTVVHLKLWEGATFEAIAGILDIPPNTAASRYRYGLDKLRAHLRPFYDEIQ